ncbi:MAG: type II secretion system protein N, partial [Pseudomonadota bacterium]
NPNVPSRSAGALAEGLSRTSARNAPVLSTSIFPETLKSPAEAALGTVNVTISPHSGGHTAQIDNEGGQLSVSGKIDVDKTGAFRADVRLKPSANAPADLDGTLGLLGRKGSDGSYRLRHNGRLSDFL